MMLKPGILRPRTQPCQRLLPHSEFLKAAGWATMTGPGVAPKILLVGEMDYSFPLSVAMLRPAGSPLVATSYLEAHDPTEPEVYPSDDGERMAYRRHSLPSMAG